MKRIATVVGVILAVLVVGQGAAYAGWNPPPPPTSGPAPGSGSSSGSSGAPKQATVSSCRVYATASSFGLSCAGAGGGDANSPTVRTILNKSHEKAPTCWDDRISDDDLQNVYEYVQNPDAPYYLHTCIVSGLQLDSTPYHQPLLVLSQQVTNIPNGAPPCPPPYTDLQVGTCVMTLGPGQRQIVDTFQSQSAKIPDVVIAAYPSTRVRTGVPTAYVDRAEDRSTRTPTYQLGGVRMYAVMDNFSIYPFGPDGESKTCDGTADVQPSDTEQTKPKACWWTYDQSSNAEPDEVYPFRAQATWTVYVNDHPFQTFQKYSDLKLPVFDVQTLVIN